MPATRKQINYIMKAHIIISGNYGKISVPQATGINHWIVVVALAAISLLLFRWFEKKNL